MQRHELDQEIHCSADRYWELFLDDAFNVRMYEEGMGFPSCKIVSSREEGRVFHRTMTVIPTVDMPRALAKVVGDRVGFDEIAQFDRDKQVFTWRLVLAAFGDKVKITGKMHTVPHGEGRCRRLVSFEVEAKIFGIGGAVEKTAGQNSLDGWKKSATWFNQNCAP